jgi:hypothetical protein
MNGKFRLSPDSDWVAQRRRGVKISGAGAFAMLGK